MTTMWECDLLHRLKNKTHLDGSSDAHIESWDNSKDLMTHMTH